MALPHCGPNVRGRQRRQSGFRNRPRRMMLEESPPLSSLAGWSSPAIAFTISSKVDEWFALLRYRYWRQFANRPRR